MYPGVRQLICLTTGRSLRHNPVCGIFPYCSPDVGAVAALLPAKPRWSYHSNQLFHSSLILCSFCWSPKHDYSIGQSLSACGAGPVSGRSPGWLLCISHAQLVPRLAGRSRGGRGVRGRGKQPPMHCSALTEAASTSHATSLLNYTPHRQLHKVRHSSAVKQCADCCPVFAVNTALNRPQLSMGNPQIPRSLSSSNNVRIVPLNHVTTLGSHSCVKS